MKQHEDGHLGGCVKGGDPATFYPKMWEFFINTYSIQSVLDIGCGEGHSLAFFHEACCYSFGVEGCEKAIAASSIKQLINKHDFTDTKVYIPPKVDMVWCCEFVEHVESQYVQNILSTIYLSEAKYVLMTHASPGQGGYHHVNCQHPSYWISKMAECEYVLDSVATRMCRSIAFFECNSPYNHFARSGLVFKKIQSPSNHAKDAIITWASGKDFCKNPGIKVYINSLNRCGFDGDKLIFTHDMEIEDREYIESQGFKIIDVDPNGVDWVVRDRFKAWADYLGLKKYRYVGLMDAKDVLFQKDPIKEFESLHTSICLITEGKKHYECDWNKCDQEYLQSQVKIFKQSYLDWEVICAGTILGCAENIKQLIMQIWSTTLLNSHATDQAVLNYLIRVFPNNYCYLIDPRYENMAVTADLPKDVPDGPFFENGLMLNGRTRAPYCIYHQ